MEQCILLEDPDTCIPALKPSLAPSMITLQNSIALVTVASVTTNATADKAILMPSPTQLTESATSSNHCPAVPQAASGSPIVSQQSTHATTLEEHLIKKCHVMT